MAPTTTSPSVPPSRSYEAPISIHSTSARSVTTEESETGEQRSSPAPTVSSMSDEILEQPGVSMQASTETLDDSQESTPHQEQEPPTRKVGEKGIEMVHFGEQQVRGGRDKKVSGEGGDEIQITTVDIGLQRLESNSSDATGIGGHTLGTSNSLFNSVASSQRSLFRSATSSAGTRSWTGIKSKKKTVKGTPEGRRLAALGFEEELSRTFDFWASWGIGMSNIGFMPGTFWGFMTAMETGGGSMYAVCWPLVGVFMCTVAAVLGEMASAYPVAGAMFTWTFRLSRSSRRFDSSARYFSWIVGSFMLCYHILTQIVLAYQLASTIQGIVLLYSPTYQYDFWQTMAIGWGVLFLSALIVSSRLSRSPWLWRGCGFGLVIGFITMNVVLLAKAPHIRSARTIFTEYHNGTGWNSKSYVYMLGWTLTCVASGMEACAHIAEDTKSPTRTVPLAMFWSTAVSYMMGWVTICVLLATTQSIGVDAKLPSAIGLLVNTVSLPFTTLILVIILFSMASQNIAQLLATSRFVWALARETALPFSLFFRRLSTTSRQPYPAIWVTVGIAALALLLLGISQEIVGTILLEGAGWSVIFAYAAPIALYLFCPRDALTGDGRAKWTLRAWSQPLAWFAVSGCSVCLVMYCLPTNYPVTPINASYSAAIAVAILLLSTLAWVFYGNARYAGPIKTTTRWTVGAEIELPSTTKSIPDAGASDPTSADHGRSAHIFSSFPTLMSNDDAPSSRGDDEESRISPLSTEDSYEDEEESRWRHQQSGTGGLEDEGVRGRERSVNGRERWERERGLENDREEVDFGTSR